jgi:hypothetical protein
VVFQADYNGPGGAEGGTGNIVTFGGTSSGVFSNANQTVQIGSAAPFATGSGNYLNVHWSQTTGGIVIGYTPDSAASSFGSFVGPTISSNGHSYLNLNGGFDVFIRLNVADSYDYGSGPGASATWLGAAYCNGNLVSGTSGLGLFFNGANDGALRLQLSAGNPGAITNFTKIFGAGGSTSPLVGAAANIYCDSAATLFAIPGVWHIGFTFSTDANGLISLKTFATPGTGAIDATSTVSEVYGATLMIDASSAGANPLGGPWYQTGNATAGVDCDYDLMRIYAGTPAQFPGLASNLLPGPSVDIAPMTWTQRSDWINVKTDPGIAHHAAGDGTTDDTQAIQDALNLASQVGLSLNGAPLTVNQSIVYLPPGTYNISSTLKWNTGGYGIIGAAMVGCGKNTTIAWHGAAGGTMFLSTGVAYSRYVGIRWDGQNVAASGVMHQVQLPAGSGIAEDPVRHSNEAFLNFTGVALNFANRSGNEWTGGCEVWNCLFYNCKYGSQIGLNYPNDYEYLFEGCEFESCGTGIDSHGNVAQMTYDTHFDHSSVADMTSAAPIRARRCTSTGSQAFITMPAYTGYGGQLHVIQDCWVDSWKNLGAGINSGAITLGDVLLSMIFDCKFTNPPDTSPPINLNCRSAGPLTGASNVIVANNSFPGLTNQTDMVQISGSGLPLNVVPINVPPAKANVGITTTLSSAQHVFLQSGAIADSPAVLDVTQAPYSAKRDASADASQTIQQAIADAIAANNGSIVYIPAGYYLVGSTINVTGGNYTIQGSGYWTQLCWTGADGGSLFSVNTPANVRIEQLMTKIPSITAPNAMGISVTSAGASQLLLDNVIYYRYGPGGAIGGSPPAGFFPYRSNPYMNFAGYTAGQGLVLSNLASGSQIYLGYSDGPLTIHDCGQAEIFANHINAGRVWVDGATKPKSGFLGILYANLGVAASEQTGNLFDVNIRDSQDYVNSDFYNEQTQNNLDLDGGTATWSGRVTIQAFRQQNFSNATAVTENNYNGWCFYGPQSFTNLTSSAGASAVYAPVKITLAGTNPFTLILPVDNFLAGAPNISADGSSSLIQVGNETLASDYFMFTALPNAPATLSAANAASISAGLDHLRQLGLEDLKLTRGLFPAVTSLSLSNQTLTITWSSVPGATYQVQSTSNLAGANWSNIVATVIANSLTTSLSVPIGGLQQQFYRVALVSP